MLLESVLREKNNINNMIERYRLQISELKTFDKYQLYRKKRGVKTEYYYKIGKKDRLHYIGWRNEPELLEKLIERERLLRRMKLLDENKTLIERFVKEYHHEREIFKGDYETEVRRLRYGKVYRKSRNRMNRHELIHDTGLGFHTRSKSEAIIARILHEHGIPFAYEAPLRIQTGNGRWKTVYPDFTIYLANGKRAYLEHLGLFSIEKYRERFLRKAREYYENGLVVSRDIFFTMDGPDGELDAGAIENLVKNMFVPMVY